MVTGSGEPPVDKHKTAIALSYEREKDSAPVVTAKGKGYIAEAIIDLAKKHNITIREDADLAMMLSKIDIDTPIPLEAYAAVAEILSYVYQANDKAKKKAHES